MRGSLESSSVVDLCRGLAEATSTGTLELERSDGTGRILFRDGRVRSAASPAPSARLGDRLVNAALLTQEQLDLALEQQAGADERKKLGAILVERDLVSRDAIRVFVQEQILDAVFELVGWREGTYEFARGGADDDDKLPVDMPVDQLLVEVSRRQSEWDQIARVLPDLDMIPDFTSGGSSADAALEPDEFAILASVDGQRSVRDLAAHLGYSEFEAARIVYGLTLIGVIAVNEPAGGHYDEADAVDPAGVGERSTDAAVTPTAETEDVDVGMALEEALHGEDQDEDPEEAPTSSTPEVRLHIDDDGTFPRRGEGGESDLPEADLAAEFETTPPELEPEPETTPELDDDAATSSEVMEPEPWTPEQAGLAIPEQEPEDDRTASDDDHPPEGTGTEETGTDARDELDDDEFERLINELAGAPASRPEPEFDEPPSDERDTPARADADADEHRPDRSGSAPDPDPSPSEPGTETGPAPSQRGGGDVSEREGGDVSEFLRELSRLAVDEDEGGGAEPIARPKKSDAPEKDEPPAKRPEEERSDDDDKKKRGFFGWGR